MGHNVSKKHHHEHKDHQSYNPGQPARPPQQQQQQQPVPAQANRIQPSRLHDLSRFAVIAVIFNPIQYSSRYQHYHNFQRYMAQSGVALYTIECIFESTEQFGLAKQTFQVTDPQNPKHIQIVAPSIFWIKENLINIAVNHLPENIHYIAWIDADIEFDNPQWAHLTIDALERYPIVQLFELSYFLGPNGKNQVLRRDYSFGYSIRNNKIIDPSRYDEWYAHPGYAWAMRRYVYNQMGGLLDFCIVGSGDLHYAFALLGRIEETIRPQMHPDYQSLALQWGSQLAQIANYGENVGYVPMNLYHFWHGDRDRRHYVNRWGILEKHQFSPLTDLAKEKKSGLIRLANDGYYGVSNVETRLKALERDIVNYFKSREEDNRQQNPLPRGNPAVDPKKQKPPPSRGRVGGFVPKLHSNTHHSNRPIWSSGPHGTHIDDPHPYCDPCICPGHIHCADNHACPCPPDHHPHDHHDHHHHHDEGDHHHHHYDGDHHHHHDSHDWGTSDYNHTDYHSGDGGGGFGTTDYGGPGSFY